MLLEGGGIAKVPWQYYKREEALLRSRGTAARGDKKFLRSCGCAAGEKGITEVT